MSIATGTRILFLLTVACLSRANLARGASVSIYSPPDTPALRFAARDLQQVLEHQGCRAKIVPISKMPARQEQTQIVLGVASDKPFLQCLQASGVAIPGPMAPEGYAIRLARHDDLVTVWTIGADATGAMYAGLALAETIAHDGIKGVEETDCSPYIAKRGLKINVPLDARTPAYADCGNAAQQNMAVMWDLAITDKCWKPGGRAAADEIQAHADIVLQKLIRLREATGDRTWQRTLGDIEAMAHLGLYYAEKLRAADSKETQTQQAVEHLKQAAVHWENYAAVGSRQYKSQLLSKGGWADWEQGCENARKDISLLGGDLR